MRSTFQLTLHSRGLPSRRHGDLAGHPPPPGWPGPPQRGGAQLHAVLVHRRYELRHRGIPNRWVLRPSAVAPLA